jgi:ATP-dependent exoDNAse (exonuclease V) alpha subunit
MGLFFFRKEIEREQFAQRLDLLESQIAILNARLDDFIKQKNIAKAVEKAHESHPSLEQRMKKKQRSRRIGTYAEKQYNEPFKIALYFKSIDYSLNSIAAILNSKSFKTPQGNEFGAKAVRDLLANKHQLQQFNYEKQKNQKANGMINGNGGQNGLNSGYVPPF